MINRILDNLKESQPYECYQNQERVYYSNELYQYVCNIYHFLLAKDEKNIVVIGHKEIYMIASFLACSCAGKTYIPIDSYLPKDRKELIINQLGSPYVIDSSIEKIMQKDEYEDIKNIYMKDDDIYYIIFTSGSTGVPKGVQITYRNLKSCLNWLENITKFEKSVILNQANFSFDLSVADIYLSLLTKSKHYVLEKNVKEDFKTLFEKLSNSKTEIMVITPSFANYLLVDKSFDSKLMPKLKTIIFCGETLHKATILRLKERFENIEIINCYGPTECTFAVTSEVVEDGDISIGVTKEDVKIYIVNEEHNIETEEVIGEILITGESVGAGYVDNISRGYITFEEKKGYLTGDLGYYKNGKLYYVGRKDRQIKYKGYRIELSEIEAIIGELEFVENVAVIARRNDDESVNRIIAFIQLNKEVLVQEIRDEIRKKIPAYMMPAIKIINKMPLTENGKVNERELLQRI